MFVLCISDPQPCPRLGTEEEKLIRRTGWYNRPVLPTPYSEILVAVVLVGLLVEEVVGRVRHKRRIADVC